MPSREKMSPFFSVVIPALNEAKVLPLLLSDLQAQTWQEFDVYVVDGGSKDKTVAIVEQLQKKDTRFHVLKSPVANVGVQRNFGAYHSSGKNIIFLDADSRIPVYFLEEQHVQLLKCKADGWSNYAEPGSHQRKDKWFILVQNTAFDGACRMRLPAAVGACMGSTRTAFTKIGGFDETLFYMEDSMYAQQFPQHHLRFVMFREPKYTFSMRRFRKEGTLKMTRLSLSALVRWLRHDTFDRPVAEYPMLGGEYFRTTGKNGGKTKTYSLRQLRELQKVLLRVAHSRQKTLRWLMEDLKREL